MITRNQLGRELQSLDEQVHALVSQYSGNGPFRKTLFVPSDDNLGELDQRASRLQREVTGLISISPLDAAFKDHLRQVLQWLRLALRDDPLYPVRYVFDLNNVITNYLYLFPDLLPDAEKVDTLSQKLSYLEPLLGALLERGQEVDDSRLLQCQRRVSALAGQFQEGASVVAQWEAGGLLAQRFVEAANRAETAAAQLGQLVGSKRVLSDLVPYRQLVDEAFAFDLPWVQSWYKEDLAAAEERVRKEAARLDRGRTPFEILDQDLGPYGSPEEMFAAARAAMARARQGALRYITLPEGELCEVSPLQPAQADQLPWGAAGSGASMDAKALRGKYFLNQFNYQAVTRGWVLMMAVHEVYPGHHAHGVKTYSQDLPLTFQMSGYGRAQGLLEGLAHRSEQLLIDVFAEAAYPLFVYYRQLHTTLRIRAQIELSVEGKPADEVAQLYVEGMKLSLESARMQVYSQEMNPGRTFCYYYGMKVLEERFPQYGLSVEEYTNRIFSCGYVSLDTLDQLLRAVG